VVGLLYTIKIISIKYAKPVSVNDADSGVDDDDDVSGDPDTVEVVVAIPFTVVCSMLVEVGITELDSEGVIIFATPVNKIAHTYKGIV